MNAAQAMLPVTRSSSLPPMRTRVFISSSISRIVSSRALRNASMMPWMEEEMKTRVRMGGKDEDRVTGNMTWAEFIHTTSRPVDGLPDPQLHAHVFVFNTTWDEEERRWKGDQFADIKRGAPYFQAAFRVRLANTLR